MLYFLFLLIAGICSGSMKKLIRIILLGGCLHVVAQSETTKWHFGQSVGLNFMTSPPSQIVNSMASNEGCASMSDANGNLLFYTNGLQVWNQQNVIMANGNGLFGNPSTVQSALIIKQPGSATIYYLFTLASQGQGNGLCYSIIDMSLAAGMGSVTTKNVPLYAPSSEMLSGVQHCNGTDFWVVSHQYGNNNFASHLFTAGGVNPTPVISAQGSTVGATAQGGIKFSPDGRKLGMTTFNSVPIVAELFDFDVATGIVSNSLSLLYNLGNIYGCEFSPDGTKFYASSYSTPSTIYQWNLCAGSPAAIQASSLVVGSGTAGIGALQTAPDGKIYCSRWGTQALGIINNPNALGAACNYVDAGLVLTSGNANFGLPNFVCSLFKPINSYTISAQMSCNTVSFSPSLPPNANIGCNATSAPATGYLWDFGEPLAGAGNTSTLSNPVHSYGAAGSYTVKLKQFFNCSIETSTLALQVVPGPTIAVTGSLTVCAGKSTSLTASGANVYTWNSATVAPSVVLAPAVTTTYSVVGTATAGNCQGMKTVTVTVLAAPSLSISSNFSICAGNQVTLTSSGANSYSWTTGSGSSSVVVSPTTTTAYTVTGTGTLNTCTAAKTISVTVFKCTGIEALAGQGQPGFYPNPFRDQFSIDMAHPAEIHIYSQLGSLVYSGDLQKGKNDLNLHHLSAGIFFASITTESGTSTLRLLKTE